MVAMAEIAGDDFYAAVGRSLLRWRRVETAIYGVFSDLLRPLDERVIVAVWHSHSGLHNRMELITALLDAHGSGELATDWRRLLSDIKPASAIRNRIAHADVTAHVHLAFSDTFGGAEGSAEEGWTFQLSDPEPTRDDSRRHMPKTEILSAGEAFLALSRRVEKFRTRIAPPQVKA